MACNDSVVSPLADTVSGIDGVGIEVSATPDAEADPCAELGDGTACDDLDPCTLNDRCQAGLCVGGTNNPCESTNPCRVGSCDSASGCVFENLVTGETCDLTCFGEARCVDGTCEAVTETKVLCEEPGEEEPCLSSRECDPATGECSLEIYLDVGEDCDSDSNACTWEICDALGVCASTNDLEDCGQEKLGSPCELWACAPKTGACIAVGFAGEVSCTDGNACTYNDTCFETEFGFIVCQGTPVPVDDSNLCTDDSCVDGTVLHTPLNGLWCDPADGCAGSGICAEGACAPDKVCDCVVDDDCPEPEDLCKGTLFCDDGICAPKPGASIVCPASTQPCQVSTCVPETGTCIDQGVDDDVACDDGNVCTSPDACQSGVCVSGSLLDCDNGSFCDGQETCDASLGCQLGQAPSIDDGVGCTQDSCDEALGAVVHAVDPTQCQDGVLCTLNTCTEVGCVFVPQDSACDNGLFCDGQETCDTASGCVTTNVPALDDGVDCTLDACDEAADSVVHTLDDSLCKDAFLCTADVCSEVGCLFQTNDAYCDNGLFCDGVEVCSAGLGCQPGSTPSVDDGVACTQDACNEVADLVEHLPVASACDDGHACTADSCTPVGCVHEDVDGWCDDNNTCTDNACMSGACVFVANFAVCDDGDPCTLTSACDQSVCVPLTFQNCDDNNVCTTDFCLAGLCQHTPNQEVCDDGEPCTSGDVCGSGSCAGPSPTLCSDGNACTDDGCDFEEGCVFSDNSDACDDGDACTTVDACSGGTCEGTVPADCEDGNLCTDLDCDILVGCTFPANNAGCEDGNACTVDDVCAQATCAGSPLECDDDNMCTDDSCDPGTGCVWAFNTLECDDGDACSFEDTCTLGVCVGLRYTDGKVKGSIKLAEGLGGFSGDQSAYDSFGSSAAGIGDLDGDGVPDVAIGAPNDDDGGNGSGALWILFLNVDGTVKEQQKISSLSGGFQGTLFSQDAFGSSLASLGDLDGDGVNELAVGSPGNDTGGSGVGAVWILFMNPDGTVKVEQELAMGEGGFAGALLPGDQFGYSLGNLGDLDGDGRPELAVGAPGTDGLVFLNQGAFWILHLNANGTVEASLKFQDVSGTDGASAATGVSVVGPGDINGDGFRDIMVGSHDNFDAPGALWVLFLTAEGQLNTTNGSGYIKLSDGLNGSPSTINGSHFGGALAASGDLDGDGIPDVIAGRWGQTSGCLECGTVSTLFLNSDGTIKKTKLLGLNLPQNGFNGPLYGLKPHWGRSLAFVGDVDKDGLLDFVAGANEDDISPAASCFNCGATFLLFMKEDPFCVL